MKKIFAALLVFALLFSCALAESAPSRTALNGSIALTVQGKTIVLDYDSDPEYSNIMNSSIQASFFKETEDGTMYELYLLFPDTVKTGDTVSTQSSIQAGQSDPGVMIFITGNSQDIYAAAFQYGTEAYPAGSSYEIRFDSVVPSGSASTYKGSMSATLMVIDKLYNPQYPLENVSGAFEFTFDMNSKYSPRLPGAEDATPAPDQPEASPDPFASVQPETSPNPFVAPQPDATPAPEVPFIPYAPIEPKNTPSLIPPDDAQKI